MKQPSTPQTSTVSATLLPEALAHNRYADAARLILSIGDAQEARIAELEAQAAASTDDLRNQAKAEAALELMEYFRLIYGSHVHTDIKPWEAMAMAVEEMALKIGGETGLRLIKDKSEFVDMCRHRAKELELEQEQQRAANRAPLVNNISGNIFK